MFCLARGFTAAIIILARYLETDVGRALRCYNCFSTHDEAHAILHEFLQSAAGSHSCYFAVMLTPLLLADFQPQMPLNEKHS